MKNVTITLEIPDAATAVEATRPNWPGVFTALMQLWVAWASGSVVAIAAAIQALFAAFAGH